jgi:guanyl-specific ribonuclease Sa
MCGWNAFQARTGGLFRGPNHRLRARSTYRDIQVTLARIAVGYPHPHHHHGTVFRNAQGLLPTQALGYYHEYVHQAAAMWGTSPYGRERLILGSGGEIFYTHDHYGTFFDLA